MLLKFRALFDFFPSHGDFLGVEKVENIMEEAILDGIRLDDQMGTSLYFLSQSLGVFFD